MNIHVCLDVATLLYDGLENNQLSDLLSLDDNHLHLRWGSLLKYLNLQDMFSSLPVFDQSHPLFEATVHVLSTYRYQGEVEYVFDSLFAENLTNVKSLKEIDQNFLLKAMARSKLHPSPIMQKKIEDSFKPFIASLTQDPYQTLHSLILYLAWDRMCLCIKNLFDFQSADPSFKSGINILKECLLESYLHITREGRCALSLSRLLEALLYFHVREENISSHNDHDWNVLSKGLSLFPSQDGFIANMFYIDDVFSAENGLDLYVTTDVPEVVEDRFKVAKCLISKIDGVSLGVEFFEKKVASI